MVHVSKYNRPHSLKRSLGLIFGGLRMILLSTIGSSVAVKLSFSYSDLLLPSEYEAHSFLFKLEKGAEYFMSMC